MVFKKGHKSGMFGKKHSEKTKKKMSKIRLEILKRPGARAKCNPNHSPETKRKMSMIKKKQLSENPEYLKLLQTMNKGKHRSPATEFKSGSDNPNWDKYDHRATFYWRARRIMEKKLGRKLRKGEVVHHLDHNYKNNSKDNLVLFSNNKKHMKYHFKLKSFIKEELYGTKSNYFSLKTVSG